jgi:hypothetical protein
MRLSLPRSKLLLLSAAIFFGGCAEEDICNMTPSVVPQNQSNKYTFAMGVQGTDGNILQKSIQPYVVINGERNKMKQHPDGNNVFVFDYRFDGLGTIPYYFELGYEVNRHGTTRTKSTKSDLYHTTITNKYIFTLDANRGIIGTRVSVVGYGLSRDDRIRIGERILPTKWLSTGVIEFTVPPMECDREYEVSLLANRKEFPAGTFYIDPSNLYCSSDFIRIDNGESQRLVFMLDQAAPEDGIDLDIVTDIPNDVIMPEVRFLPGERTVSVNITGGEQSAKGTLFVNAHGFSPLEIPIKIGDGHMDEVASDDTAHQPYSQQPIPSSDDDDVVVI